MPGFHHSVAVLPFPLRKFRKNYVSAVRITLSTWKIILRRCRGHLPLRRNRRSVAIGSNPIFAIVSLVENQSAFWPRHPYVYGKTFPAFPFSRATATVATERKNGNGHGMVETRHYSLCLRFWTRDATPSAVMPQYVLCPSVWLWRSDTDRTV